MPDPDYTALGIVLDESGSMAAHEEAAIEGYNEFLDHQQGLDAGRATITRTVFDHEFPPDMRHHDLDAAEPLSEENYNPGGRTALLDAVGYTIDEMGQRFEEMDESDKPSAVFVAIITDGKENASEEYTRGQLRSMIGEQEQIWDWEFVFVGAGIEDFSDARSMGMADQDVSQQSADADGFRKTYDEIATAAANVRRRGTTGDFRDGGALEEETDEPDS